MSEYTVDELLALDGKAFRAAVVDDLYVTCEWTGPFQDERVVQRTLSTLNGWADSVAASLRERAENPNCPAEVYEKTRRFHDHLEAVVKNTEKRIGLLDELRTGANQWKQLLFEVVDALKAGWDDDDILDLTLPDFDHTGAGLTVDQWHEIRLVKRPGRKRAERVA